MGWVLIVGLVGCRLPELVDTGGGTPTSTPNPYYVEPFDPCKRALHGTVDLAYAVPDSDGAGFACAGELNMYCLESDGHLLEGYGIITCLGPLAHLETVEVEGIRGLDELQGTMTLHGGGEDHAFSWFGSVQDEESAFLGQFEDTTSGNSEAYELEGSFVVVQ